MTTEKEPCNVEDVLCQMETLRHLRGLQKELGSEQFENRFPDLRGLSDRITDELLKEEGSLADALERCQASREESISLEQIRFQVPDSDRFEPDFGPEDPDE